jgi:hypothetical protein
VWLIIFKLCWYKKYLGCLLVLEVNSRLLFELILAPCFKMLEENCFREDKGVDFNLVQYLLQTDFQ